MPGLWQLDAESFLETACRIKETPKERAEMLELLFKEKYDQFSWEIVVNPQLVLHKGKKFIKLSVKDKHIPTRMSTQQYVLFSVPL